MCSRPEQRTVLGIRNRSILSGTPTAMVTMLSTGSMSQSANFEFRKRTVARLKAWRTRIPDPLLKKTEIEAEL